LGWARATYGGANFFVYSDDNEKLKCLYSTTYDNKNTRTVSHKFLKRNKDEDVRKY